MRSWKGRRSSVTLFPWSEIPPPSNGIYKYKCCKQYINIKETQLIRGVYGRMCVSLFSTCHAIRSLRRASLSLSSECCWMYSSVKNAWYQGNIKSSFHDVSTHMCTLKEHQSYPVRDIITLNGFWGWTLIIFRGMNTPDFNNFIAFNVIWTELTQSLKKGILIFDTKGIEVNSSWEMKSCRKAVPSA